MSASEEVFTAGINATHENIREHLPGSITGGDDELLARRAGDDAAVLIY